MQITVSVCLVFRVGAAYPEMGLTGVAMVLEPGIALLGVMPMSTESTSKAIGGRPCSDTIMSCKQCAVLHTRYAA